MYKINNKEEFFKIQRGLDRISSEQSQGWHNYKKSMGGREICYYVDSSVNPKIAIWGSVFILPILKKRLLIIDGESLSSDITQKQIQSFFTELVKTEFTGIELNSNTEYNIDYEIGLRRSGFLRPFGYFLSPLTMEIDLTSEFQGNRNCKRNIKNAIEHELEFKEVLNISDNVLDQIVLLQKELSQLKGIATGFRKSQLSKLIHSDDFRVFFVCNKEGHPIASRIIHCHQQYVTDVYAPNSSKSRGTGATYYMMKKLFEQLKSEGFTKFDFGRIGPSTHSSDSVFVFKNSFSGRKLQYNGEWAFYKNKIIELVILAYKLKYKQPRY